MDSLDVANKQNGYVYRWVNCTSPQTNPGYFVMKAQAEQIYSPVAGYYVPVWEVVKGNQFPEAKSRMQADGTRRIGDTLLMRARRDYYEAVERHRENKRLVQKQEANFGMTRLAHQAERRGLGVAVHPDLSESRPDYMRARTMASNARPQMSQQQPSMDTMERQIRNGGIPGAEVETWAHK